MRTFGPALVAALWLSALSRSASANGWDLEFDDESSLSTPAAETGTTEVDRFALLGLRAGAARLELHSRSEPGASVLALVAVDVARSSFQRHAPSWGYSDQLLFSFGLGYGLGVEAAFAVGPLLTTDGQGSGAFLRFGAEGGSLRSRPGSRSIAFAHVPIGYRLRRESWQIEAAVLPALGGIAVADDERLSGLPWFRQRLSVRLEHVQLKLERGATNAEATATHARAELCAVARRPPLVSCTFFETFDRESVPRARFAEVGILLGIGAYWTTTREEAYSDPIVTRRFVSR